MGTILVIMYVSGLDFVPCILQRHEPVLTRHFCRRLLLNDCTVALSVGVPGREKSMRILLLYTTTTSIFLKIQSRYRFLAIAIRDV